jgi:putative SOS response-associated peptidase YedK
MPVTRAPEPYAGWLDTAKQNAADLTGMLASHPWPDMKAYPVGEIVNNARNEDPRCIEPVDAA